MNGLETEHATPAEGAMERFKTRTRAGVARRVYLYDPGTGEKTEHYLDIVSSMSDQFRRAKDSALQEAGEIAAIKDPELRAERLGESQLKMKASLVSGWSFDEAFSKEALLNFLREAPQVQDLIIAIADDNEGFFGKPSTV